MSWSFCHVGEFAQHQDAWLHINQQSANSPMLDPDLIAPLIGQFASGREILAVYSPGGAPPRAMAVLTRRAWGAWETFQPSQAPLGAWVMEPSLDVRQLMVDLLRALPGFSVVIGVTQQDPDLIPRPEDSGCLKTLDYIETARIVTASGFEDFWAARGKNLRHNMKRQRNRLEKDGIVTRLETLTRPDDVRVAVENYGRLESAGWKNALGTAIHPSNRQGRFYTETLERFAATGDARMYQYWYNDRLVAMDLCVVRYGTLVILKTTYDEGQTTSSPALLMRQESIKRIFDDSKVSRIEFYGKLMDWHTKWSTDIRTLYHLNHYRWPIVPRLNHLQSRLFELRIRR